MWLLSPSTLGRLRDVIEVELDLDGLPVILCDTAGIREASDQVEAIGIERSLNAMETADLTVWLEEAVSTQTPTKHKSGLVVASKMDNIGFVPDWAAFGISVHSGVGLDRLVEQIKIDASQALAGEPALVTNARQRNCVEAAARQAERTHGR